VHVRNELTMNVPCEAAWAWLLRARLWPTWYRNSANVDYLNSDSADLAEGTRFRWKTFGVRLESTVLELVPGERIAWDAHGPGVDAYHAWVLGPAAGGCHVLTEETQHGWLAVLAQLTLPNRMHKYHQVWLEALRDQAARGLPPHPVR
jgi:polyketide cyclase/dehydrase/lipid transport protein